MFNLKATVAILGAATAILFASSPNLEAGHWHRHHPRSHVNFHFGPVVPAPTYIVESPAYVPVYVAPQPVVTYPVYQTVYVAPQPRLFTGFSFNWFFR